MAKEKLIGITVKKDEEFSEWYTQTIQKAELIEYSPVSGCMVIRPWAYRCWELLTRYLDNEFKKLGVENAMFPMLIPESLLKREAEHVEGFNPEVAWVTHAGSSKLPERLAIRPTSETIMYDSYKKWIRSHRDLPLKLNQWCNVVRWEFKHPVPFLRTREFLWQEGHTVHATKEGADEEAMEILTGAYTRVHEELLAVPVIAGRKSESEKFAGADYTLSLETIFPNGKGIQACTSHHLGQHFSKAFDITFLDEQQRKQHPYQNSWGLTTRSLGIAFAMHGDDKGLILPPRIAPIHAVIVPIFTDEKREEVLIAADRLTRALATYYRIHLDDRDTYTPGWKFNHWELKGVPVRIELGPRDLEKEQAIVVRRDTGEKEPVALKHLQKRLQELLEAIQLNLYDRAKQKMAQLTRKATTIEEIAKAVREGCAAEAMWDGTSESEARIKEETGAKILNIPFEEKKVEGQSVSGTPAKHKVIFARSY